MLLYASVLGLSDTEIYKISENKACYGLHIDIMDGIAVPNYGFDIAKLAILLQYNKPIQLHIMAITSSDFLKNICKFNGIESIFIHPCWTCDLHGAVDIIRKHNIKAGIVWNYDDTEKYFDNFDEVLYMTVNPGFGGQKMLQERLDMIKSMRHDKSIWIDGGINSSTIMLLHEINPTGVIAGSGFNEIAMKSYPIQGL